MFTLGLALALFLGRPTATAAATPTAGALEPGRSDPRAVELLRRVDDLWRGDGSHTVMTMRVKTSHYERTLKLEAWTQGKAKTLVEILAPAKDAGTMTLKNGEAIYTYLPRTDRTIKLNAGMMGGSWMGSHFTNDDLVKDSRLSDDYISRISFEGPRGGRDVIEMTLMPKATAAVVWGRIVVAIDAKTLMPLRSVYDDEDLKPARTMTFGEIKDFGGRMAPASLRLTPADLPGEYTELTYQSMAFDPALGPDTFSLARLKRRGP
jgi:outer membrane lipoprotein-sorting protein